MKFKNVYDCLWEVEEELNKIKININKMEK